MAWFSGKKTYILAALAVLTGVVNYLVGDMGLTEAVQYVWGGGAIAALRAGIAKS